MQPILNTRCLGYIKTIKPKNQKRERSCKLQAPFLFELSTISRKFHLLCSSINQRTMKKSILLVASILLAHIAISQILSRKIVEISDYFIKLPKCTFDKNTSGKALLDLRNSMLIPGNKHSVTIDKTRGFLKISDNIMKKYEITLKEFRKNDKGTIVVLQEFYQGDSCDTYSIKSYAYDQKSGELVEIKNIIPTILFDSFTPEPTKKPALLSMDSNIVYQYTFPSEGEKITVTPVALKNNACLKLRPVSKTSKTPDKDKTESIALYRSTISELKIQSLDLIWRSDKGVFEQAGK